MAASLVALLVALSGAAGAQTTNGPVFEKVGFGEGLCADGESLRDLNLRGVGDGTNIAVFKVNLNWEHPDLEPNYVNLAMPSLNPRFFKTLNLPKVPANLLENGGQSIYEAPIKGHSEKRLIQALESWGIDGAAVEEVCSERMPCALPGSMCKDALTDPDDFPNLKKVQYNEEFPYSPKGSPQYEQDLQTRKQSNAALKAAIKQRAKARRLMNPECSEGGGGGTGVEGGALRAQRAPSRSALAATGSDCGAAEDEDPDNGALPDELGDPAEALDPGGIDFSSLQLRYLSLSGPHQDDLHYSMDSDGTPVTTDPNTGLQTAQEDSTAFFTWLTLPPSTFWVNLSPNTPPNVIDPRMALTDVGRVMLQSDLLLKQTSIAAQNPAIPAADQLWQQMLALPPGSDTATGRCLSFRLWIVPDVATVHATKTQLYILSAPLKVKMALVTHLPGTLLDPICPHDLWETTFLNAYRQFILPQITQAVNTAPQFEPLRRVYMSRVAAQWVRQEAGPHTVMGQLVDSGLHRNWIARPGWSPNAIWEQYIQQFNATPTAYTVPVQENGTTVNATVYASGGVDLRHKVREQGTSNRQFKARYPGLAAAAKHSVKRPSQGAGTTLVGGGISLRSSPHVGNRRRPSLFYVFRHGAWLRPIGRARVA